MAFHWDMVKNLIVKYPVILSKNETQVKEYFSTLEKYGVD
jgi:hypothetical protein